MSARILRGDCLEVLRAMPDASVDAIVTDPPYGISFMGKAWDHDGPRVDVWTEALRVLKPGGHLVAFAGTRTQHRMASSIEDAGFEIRDMIAWVHGSGLPKSLNVSKAIDKGAEREVVGSRKLHGTGRIKGGQGGATSGNPGALYATKELRDDLPLPAPATDAARQWSGWGTSLKPALETITVAAKPCSPEQDRHAISSTLLRLEARLWLLSPAIAAAKSSPLSQREHAAACVIAQWSADEITNTRAALCGQMDTSLFESATTSSLNIVSSWRLTLSESWDDGSTSTIATGSSTTIDLKTLRFSLSQITPSSIIQACSLPGGFHANASTAERYSNAAFSLLRSIRTLSATEPAMLQVQAERLGAGVTPNLDPCIMARKPLIGTVARNVLEHGTGAINVDGCRIQCEAWTRPGSNAVGGVYGDFASDSARTGHDAGRWPANVMHDGSDEVLEHFPESKSGANPTRRGGLGYGSGAKGQDACEAPRGAESGSAARFFFEAKHSEDDAKDSPSASRFKYCAKASRKERGEGNKHPTVKPVALMRWLVRLITPPGGHVLDPFTGSGTTGVAAVLEGFDFTGIEREEAYADIAERRIGEASANREELAQAPDSTPGSGGGTTSARQVRIPGT